MKKLLAILFVVLLAFSCFTVAMVSAEENVLLTSDFDGETKWVISSTKAAGVGLVGTFKGDYVSLLANGSGAGRPFVTSPVTELVVGKKYELSFAVRLGEENTATWDPMGYPTAAIFEVDEALNVGDALPGTVVPKIGNNDYAYSHESGSTVVKRTDFVGTWEIGGYAPVEFTGWSFIDYAGSAGFPQVVGEDTFQATFTDWVNCKFTFTAVADEEGETAQKVAVGLGLNFTMTGYGADFKDVVLKEVVCEHEYTQVEGKKDATCTEAGYTGDTVCLDCGAVVTKGEAIDAGHKLDKVAAVEATHEAAGNKEHYACSVCKKLFSDAEGKTEIAAADVVVDKIAHVYGEELKSDAQNHWKECECGSKAEVAAHTFGDWKVTKEATETEKGAKEKECSVCGYKVEEEIPVVGAEVEEDKEQDKEEDKAEDTTSPETGDSTNVVFWFALLMVSALAVVTTVAAKKASVK